jgi:hypothetical protein
MYQDLEVLERLKKEKIKEAEASQELEIVGKKELLLVKNLT